MSSNVKMLGADAEYETGDDIEVSSMDVLEFDVEESVIRSNPEGRAVVDEVNSMPGGLCVYVRGDVVDPTSPPRKLTEKMLEHGYAYIDWVMNGTTGDDRAAFEFRPLVLDEE